MSAHGRCRVCVLGTRGIPGVQGGVEAHCEQLMPRLAALDRSLDVFVYARRGHVQALRYTYHDVSVIALPAPRHQYLEAIVHTFLAVLHARFELRARMVHFHAIGPALMAPLAKLLGLKVVVTHHSRNYLHAKWNALARLALRAGEACMAHFADRVIAVAPSMAEELRARYPKAARKIVYIPNGASAFDHAHWASPEAVLARIEAEAGSYILAVGRLTPEKGFHDLVEAVRSGAVAQKLVIAGRADHEDEYSRELMASASDRILFAGYVERGELYPLYRNASLFVLPSYHEGMPIAALEAIAADTPVLLSDIGPNKDLGLPDKHYFPVGDVEALVGKLQGAHEQFRADREAVLARYDWEDIARQTLAVYADVLRPNCAPASSMRPAEHEARHGSA